MSDLPTYVACTRKRALQLGAGFIEQEVRKRRQDARAMDAAQLNPSYAERLLIDVMEMCQASATLREMAEHER